MIYKIDFINSSYHRFYLWHKEEIDRQIQKCLSKGQLTLREELWNLEKRIAKYVGTKYAVGVNSGTDALFLSLKALGIGKGDEVITVSNTFISTIQAIVHCGATPILVDVNEDEQMNVVDVEKVITKKTKAIIPVHYTGAMVDMRPLLKLAKKYNLCIVEDACQALGAKQNSKMAGSFGIIGCFSFNTAKLLGGLCDGGMVVTNDRKIYEKVCLLRNHWNVHQLSVDRNDYPQPENMDWGWKSRLSNVNAAFLNVKLNYLPEILRRRSEIALQYLNRLNKNSCLELPHADTYRIWQEFHLRVKQRDNFKEFMDIKGIETLTRDIVPNHKMKGLALDNFNLPVTEQLAKEVIRIPLYPEMNNQEVDYIINCVNEFFQE